eukprot:753571-Hanusia_phi.AAC.11
MSITPSQLGAMRDSILNVREATTPTLHRADQSLGSIRNFSNFEVSKFAISIHHSRMGRIHMGNDKRRRGGEEERRCRRHTCITTPQVDPE